jgi:hypothetical protein
MANMSVTVCQGRYSFSHKKIMNVGLPRISFRGKGLWNPPLGVQYRRGESYTRKQRLRKGARWQGRPRAESFVNHTKGNTYCGAASGGEGERSDLLTTITNRITRRVLGNATTVTVHKNRPQFASNPSLSIAFIWSNNFTSVGSLILSYFSFSLPFFLFGFIYNSL